MQKFLPDAPVEDENSEGGHGGGEGRVDRGPGDDDPVA